MRILLISTYELGRQPFGLASPAAWLRDTGALVTCADLAIDSLPEDAVTEADLVAFYLPMHTATRLATDLIRRVRALNPAAHLCCYGLYAPMNERFLRELGVATILGGEFESGLVALARRIALDQGDVIQLEPRISLARQVFRTPDRTSLPPLTAYARMTMPDGERVVGYTETSRGCKHTCRHCPIVPIYEGHFRVVQRDIVLEDVRRQVAAGAEHITFGDPDFFNGPGHAIPLVEALHAEFPTLTYDVTIKIEHLLKHATLLPILRDTGCLFVTSAVEAVDDRILAIFDKRHTRADFVQAAEMLRAIGLPLNPTFVTFTPWTTRAGYRELLRTIAELGLVEHVAPVQYAIRLLIPAGSKLLELPEVQRRIGAFDDAALCYRWEHPDPEVDRLYEQVRRVAQRGGPRSMVFEQVWALAHQEQEEALPYNLARAPIPHLSEPWYC